MGFSVRAVQHSSGKTTPQSGAALDTTTTPRSGAALDTTTTPRSGAALDTTTTPQSGAAQDTTKDMGYRLTRQDLMRDLYVAFFDARKHKASMSYVVQFEKHLKRNLEDLCDALMSRTYTAQPSKCFIIDYPKKREVFAAKFVDRVVHHLYYNYTNQLFERTFIQDTYSCIKGRGTHYGIERLDGHIRKESQNYQVPCHVLKLDIRGYFMHINRYRLLEIATRSLLKMSSHRCGGAHGTAGTWAKTPRKCTTWADVIDMDFVLWLTREIILLDPKINCEIVGSWACWLGLDRSKSLFFTDDGCGLPIGNLTSQLFSNVYLNIFDQYMKRELHCKHYGRYVDDAYIVSPDKDWMLSLVPKIRHFLKAELGLDLHMGKLHVSDVAHGVEFLGAYIKPYRIYVSNQSLRRVRQHLNEIDFTDPGKVFRTVNSYLGMMVHYASFNLRNELFVQTAFLEIAPYDEGMTKMKITTAPQSGAALDTTTAPQSGVALNTKLLNTFKDNEQDLWNSIRLRTCQTGCEPHRHRLLFRSSSRRRSQDLARGVFLQEAVPPAEY